MLPSWKCLCSHWSVLTGNVTSALPTIIPREQIKTMRIVLGCFRKSNSFGIREPFWEHDGSLGTLEIFWGVPRRPEDNVGFNSLFGWNYVKYSLKLKARTWLLWWDILDLSEAKVEACCSHFISQCYPKINRRKFPCASENQGCNILVWVVYNGLSAPWIVQGDKVKAVLQNAKNSFDVMATVVEHKGFLHTDSSL